MSERPSRLAPTFAACKADKRAALVGYLPAGYPTVPESIDVFKAMVDGGCDIIEVGVAYSDPVMDGPTIQRAAETALTNGVRLRDIFTVIEQISSVGGKAVVMTYWNPVLQYGVDKFARDSLPPAGSDSSPPTSFRKKPAPGWKHPRSTTSTGSSLSPRPRRKNGSR